MMELVKSEFTERFARLNDLHNRGFYTWSFQPGMMFGAKEKWWDRNGIRQTHHEGLDIATFLDIDRVEHRLEAGMQVPPLYNGKVVNIVDDLLGRTIIVEHNLRNKAGFSLYALYGHLIPRPEVYHGTEVEATRSILGTIAPGGRCPAHLHLSLVWSSLDHAFRKFSWQDSTDVKNLKFSDPLSIF